MVLWCELKSFLSKLLNKNKTNKPKEILPKIFIFHGYVIWNTITIIYVGCYQNTNSTGSLLSYQFDEDSVRMKIFYRTY